MAITNFFKNRRCPNLKLILKSLKPVQSRARIWGSTLVELRPNTASRALAHNRLEFKKFTKIHKIRRGGASVLPNALQLALLRPQLSGGDFFIAAPHKRGKTLAYLLPILIRAHLSRQGNSAPRKVLVVVPTIDLVLLGSREANGTLRGVCRVQDLYYKNLLQDEAELRRLLEAAHVIYATPATAARAVERYPQIFANVSTLVLDEAQALCKREAAVHVVKLTRLLPSGHQTVALAPRCDAVLRQFISRLLRVEFRVVSLVPDLDFGAKVTSHFWGPQRSSVGTVPPPEVSAQMAPNSPLEARIFLERGRIIEHCKNRDSYLDPAYKCSYMVYKPRQLAAHLFALLNLGIDKVILFFPTVKMAQFVHLYFKLFGACENLQNRYDCILALHGGISPEKRRFVIDVFCNTKRGVLFATDLASLGLNLAADLCVQVGAAESIESLTDRIGNTISKPSGSSLLLLHDLDCHLLYEASQLHCNVEPSDLKLERSVANFVPNTSWLNSPQLTASCHLMYRSLLGYYCNHAARLKFQRWQVPSLANELALSFGCSDAMPVSKQFAARLQIIDAPGLAVDYYATKKTTLMARAAAVPGTRARLLTADLECDS